MTEDQNPAAMAGDEDVPEIEHEEAPTEGQEQETPTEEGKAEGQAEQERNKETARERREREKAYKAQLKQEAEEARARADEAEAKLAKIRQAGQGAQPPKSSDFPDYEDYIAAKTAYLLRSEASGDVARETEQEVQRQRAAEKEKRGELEAARLEEYSAQVTDARTRYADFDQVVGGHGLFPAGSHLVDLVLSSDASADVAYSVARDRVLHDRLLRMAPIEAAREIGRIEAQMKAPRPRTQSGAPDPINPVTPSTAPTKDVSKMTQAEFVAWRDAGGTF